MICNRKEKQASNEREAISNRIGLILISVCAAGTNSNANTYAYSNSYSNSYAYAHTYPYTNTSTYINNYNHAPR